MKDNYYPDGLPSRSDVTKSRKLGVKDNYYRAWRDLDGFPWYAGNQTVCVDMMKSFSAFFFFLLFVVKYRISEINNIIIHGT